jgi:glutathione S-transferase
MNLPIKFYYSPGSCSFAVHILLFEAKVAFEPMRIEMGNFPQEFLALNPKGRVPVIILKDDNENDQVITEAPAILTAVSLQVPERKFLGSNNLENVRVYEWMNWLSGTLHGQAFGGLWRPDRFLNDHTEEDARRLRERAVETILSCYETIERKLNISFTATSSPFAVGNALTVVDTYLAVFYRWGVRNLKLDMTRYQKYTALWKELEKLDSFRHALEQQTGSWD